MISENKENILEKIIEVLTLEDINTQILNYNNPFIIYFKNRRYCIASFNIRHSGGKNHPSKARRIQIKGTLKDTFLDNGTENICCVILGFDKKSDTFSTWEIYKNLYSGVKNWSRSKSLYTDYNIIKQASEFGASVTPENFQIGDDSAVISFKTNFLSNYLTNPKEKKIQYNKIENYILCLDHLHNRKNSNTFISKLTNLDSNIFPQTKVKTKVKSKRADQWVLEEYILVFELYLKIKNDGAADNIKNDEYKKVYEIFKKISSVNNSNPRTINALSYRVANFKYNDPEWTASKGLSGAEDDEILNFVLNKYSKDRKSLLKEIDKIIEKYFSEDNNINYHLYTRDPNNLKQQIDISIENIFDPIEVQNLIDKKKKLHENIVYILANKLKKNNFSVYEDPKGFDLYALHSDNQKAYLFEIKTITDENFISQTRSAIIQLQEYLYVNKYHYQNEIFQKKINQIILYSEDPKFIIPQNKYNKYMILLKYLNIDPFYIDQNVINSLCTNTNIEKYLE